MTEHQQLIPAAALDKHIAFLGATGSGKTSSAKAEVVEPVLEEKGRVLIIDPTGVWWGLRLSKSGKRKGYPIPIFGGRHADYPLRVAEGAALGEAYATSHGSAVFDTSLMSVEDRSAWFIAFAEALMRKNRGRLHLVIDEIHLFAFKGSTRSHGSAARMLHTANNLASLGRGLGIRITMISQRPAKVHNDVLSCAKTLVAMQMVLPHDRKAVHDWIADQADVARGKEIVATLPSMKVGGAWVWYPLGHYLEQVRFPLPQTFDSSSGDEAPGDRTLPTINLDALQGKLKTIEEEKKANDIPTLRKRIATLESELKALGEKHAKAILEMADKATTIESEKRGHDRAVAKLKNKMQRELTRKVREGLKAIQKHAGEVLQRIKEKLADIDIKDAKLAIEFDAVPVVNALLVRPPVQKPAASAPAKPAPARAEFTAAQGAAGSVLPKGEVSTLKVIAQYLDGVPRETISILTGYKRSTRDRYIQFLTSKGLVELRDNKVFALQAGIDVLGSDFEPLPTGAALRDHWLKKLPDGERNLFAPIMAAYPNAVERDALNDVGFNGKPYTRSTRDRYLQFLQARMLITTETGKVKAADILFQD